MQRFHLLTGLALCSALATGCDLPEEEPVDIQNTQSFRGTGGGGGGGGFGLGLNTNWLGHTQISEFDTAGQDHGGVILHEVRLGPKTIEDIRVVGDRLEGQISGTPIAAEEFIGSIWVVELTEGPNTGEIAEIVLADVTRADNELNRRLYRFGDVTFNDGLPTCEADENGMYDAALYGDITVDESKAVVSDRPNTIYIGCLSGAMGKASYRWGYWPFELGAEKFTAVIRMLRADFCGNGESWTSPGQLLQVVDHFGVSSSFVDSSLDNEAVWSTEGAVCIGEYTRLGEWWENVTCDGEPLAHCPSDAEAHDTFVNRGLLWTKHF